MKPVSQNVPKKGDRGRRSLKRNLAVYSGLTLHLTIFDGTRVPVCRWSRENSGSLGHSPEVSRLRLQGKCKVNPLSQHGLWNPALQIVTGSASC